MHYLVPTLKSEKAELKINIGIYILIQFCSYAFAYKNKINLYFWKALQGNIKIGCLSAFRLNVILNLFSILCCIVHIIHNEHVLLL